MEEKIKNGLKKVLKKFGFDGQCDIHDFKDGYYIIKFVGFDDRLIDKFYHEFEICNESIIKELDCKSVRLERMDAFPNGYSSYNIRIQF